MKLSCLSIRSRRRSVFTMAAALLAAGCATPPPPIPTLEPVGEYALPPGAPEGLSGIAWTGGDAYALVEDSGGRIHRARIGIDTASGAITNCVFASVQTVPDLVDGEGIACDRESNLLYVSDETGPKILKLFPNASSIPIPLPDVFAHTRPNKSLEALSLEYVGRGAGLTLWTANEDALIVDGPPASATNAPLVRIASVPPFAIKKDAGAWWYYRLDAAQGGPVPGAGAGVPFNGLAGLAALGHGRLLVLERSCGMTPAAEEGGPPSLIVISIYYVDTSRTPPGSRRPLPKTLLWRQAFPFSNYEGIALGPELADGSRAVLLVADGDASKARVGGMTITLQWKKALFSLKLFHPAP